MPRSTRFQIHEVERDGKISISIVCDEIIYHTTSITGSDIVEIQRSGINPETFTKTGNIYEISSEICNEFIIDGLLEAETIHLANTKILIPKSLQKIHCDVFHSSFLGGQRPKDWLKLVDGPLEKLKITENGIVEGLGKMERIKGITKELVAVGTDITDEELIGFNDFGILVLNSDFITEKGVKDKFEKWLNLPVTNGNHFEIRYKPSTADFSKSEIFKNLKRAELKWKQYFQFKLKYTQNSGKVEKFDGFYFITGEYHLIKVVLPWDWKPNLTVRK